MMNDCVEVSPLLADEKLSGSTLEVNKQDVARSFSLAAPTYDQVAALQRSVADNLLTKIPQRCFDNILDLGCGTGVVSAQLAQRFSTSTVFGLDIAEGMLEYARGQFSQPALHWCCADAENLPLSDNSVDLVFSSLAVQWCADFQQLCNEVKRVLKPGGTCVLATLGPETLHELRNAWQQVDGYVHVNRFIGSTAVTGAAIQAGFNCEFWQQELVMRYPELRQLTAELKALGAHNVNRGRPRGLTGRQRIEKLKAGYETFRDGDGLLPASYDVYYLRMENPA